MLDLPQFRRYIVRPILQSTELWSESAENLIVGTALIESRLTFVHQLGGVALGVMQMEPATYDDLRFRVNYKRHLRDRILKNLFMERLPDDPNALMGNMSLSIVMARLKYFFDPAPLPAADDIQKLGEYHKRIYNTPLGASKVTDFVALYEKYAT